MPAETLDMLDTITATGLGPVIGPQREARSFGAGTLPKLGTVPYEMTINCVGGTATVQVQTGSTVGGLATVSTISLIAGQTYRFVGKLTTRYIALNVSAISGATLNAYMRLP